MYLEVALLLLLVHVLGWPGLSWRVGCWSTSCWHWSPRCPRACWGGVTPGGSCLCLFCFYLLPMNWKLFLTFFRWINKLFPLKWNFDFLQTTSAVLSRIVSEKDTYNRALRYRFFDTDTILILPRSENSILILYWYFPGPGTSIPIRYWYFYCLKLRYRYDTDTQQKMLDTKGDTIIIAKNNPL